MLRPAGLRFVAFPCSTVVRVVVRSRGGLALLATSQASCYAGRPHAPALSHGRRGISQVPGQPSCARHALGPRGGLTRQASSARRCSRRLPNGVGPPNSVLSRLYHAALALAVYASRPGSLQISRKTRFRLVASLYRAGLSPAGSLRKVSMHGLPATFPPPPGFAWRDRNDMSCALAAGLRPVHPSG